MAYDIKKYSRTEREGRQLSIHKTAYKNLRFALTLEKVIVLTEMDTANLPGISYRLYGDVSYWRILFHYNGMRCPISDVRPGVKLMVPSKASITAYMSAQNTQNRQTFNI